MRGLEGNKREYLGRVGQGPGRAQTQKNHVDPFMVEHTPLILRLYLQKGAIFVCELGVMIVCARLQMHRRTCRLSLVCYKGVSRNGSQTWISSSGIAMLCMKVITHIACLFCICFCKKSGTVSCGSLQRAASQNFSEFQVRGATDWENFKKKMNRKMELSDGLQRPERWGPRRFVACVACAEKHWSEEPIPTFTAGCDTDFQKAEKAHELLDPKAYVATWPEVPSGKVFEPCPTILLPNGETVQMLLHKGRVTEGMCTGEAQAPLCKECKRCLVKNPPEVPARALANVKWLGRHPECMRKMPYGHRMLLPVQRAILTKVSFTANSKNPRERSHSACGLDGVTTSLAESFEAVFVGIDPEDLRKKQTFPIAKTLLLKLLEFVQSYSKAHKAAHCRAQWNDGETPELFQNNFGRPFKERERGEGS